MKSMYADLKFLTDLKSDTEAIIKHMCEDNGISYSKRTSDIDKTIISLKRKIRATNRTDTSELIRWDKTGEYGVQRVDFDGTFTDEEKKEYIDFNWISVHSDYDCTGKIFTYYIKVFNMPKIDRSVAYIKYSIDI